MHGVVHVHVLALRGGHVLAEVLQRDRKVAPRIEGPFVLGAGPRCHGEIENAVVVPAPNLMPILLFISLCLFSLKEENEARAGIY